MAAGAGGEMELKLAWTGEHPCWGHPPWPDGARISRCLDFLLHTSYLIPGAELELPEVQGSISVLETMTLTGPSCCPAFLLSIRSVFPSAPSPGNLPFLASWMHSSHQLLLQAGCEVSCSVGQFWAPWLFPPASLWVCAGGLGSFGSLVRDCC